MNSWKFRFLGLVITTLFLTSLIASPHRVAKNPMENSITKNASDVIKQDDLRTEKVGKVITAFERSSALGINGGTLKSKVGDVIKVTNSALRLNDRDGYVIQTEGRPDCPDGTIIDCSGDGDCCPESWIGDGFADCEDQAYGCDLTCYDNDGGDCDGGGGTTTTTTGGGNCDEVIWSTTMTYDWYCTGSPGSAAMNLCANGVADLEGLPGTWMSAQGELALGDGLCPGETIDNDLSFTFDAYTTMYAWDTEGDDIYTPGSGYHDDFGYNGGDNADGLTCINGADCSGGGGTTGGTTTGGGECPDGTIQDCVDDDCCPESWIGDGFEDCEDQAYGCDLTCYDNDGGDCDGGGGTTTTTTGGGNCDEVIWSTTMTYDWYCTGSPGSAALNLCANGVADLEGLAGTWTSGQGEVALGDGLCPGDTIDNDLSFTFDAYTTAYMWDTEGDDIYTPGSGYHDDFGYNGGDNADGLTCINGADCSGGGGTTGGTTTGGGECPDGTIQDCVDDDCCPESWIGDGFEDCEDQAYGCDLTCYDNDGGDCGDSSTSGTTSGGTTTGGNCPDGTVQDCVDDDCCPESWIGDGFEDCEDQAYGCDLTCYNNDGGDCDGGGGTTTTTGGGNCDEVVLSTTMTYDWYCTGSPGSAAMNLCANGTADLEGLAGTWGQPGGELALGDGLCPGDIIDNDLYFEFDSYTTRYTWDLEGDLGSAGAGYHDDFGYNGGDNADGLTSVSGGDATTGGTTTTTTTGGGGDAISYTMTYDWYCTGSPGSAALNLYPDGTGDLEGLPGTWMSDAGEYPLGDGLCPGDVIDNDLSFMFDNYATVYMWDQMDMGMCSDGSGYHDDTSYNGGGNADGLTSVTYLSGECGDTDPCDGQAMGDANGDGAVNVLDVVGIVNYILAGGAGLDDCGAAVADYNADGAVNVLDVVAIVNLILSGGGRTTDATDATMIQTVNGVDINADGYIGGVQMTLSHGDDFSIELTDNAYIAEYKTNGNSTMLIVINPEDEEIFTSSGDFTVDEVLVTNSQEFINVVKELPVSFTLSNAYPNPFNPTTTLTLDVTDQAFASVKVFNLRGEVVGVLMNDMVDAGSFTMTWDASNLSSGVYMIRAEAGGQIATQKVMLVK